MPVQKLVLVEVIKVSLLGIAAISLLNDLQTLGLVIVVLLIIWEIFAMSRLETSTDESEQSPDPSLSDIYEYSPNAAIFCDCANIIYYFNEAAQAIFGERIEMGRSISDLFLPWHMEHDHEDVAIQVVDAVMRTPMMRYTDILPLKNNQQIERVTMPVGGNHGRIWLLRDVSHLTIQSEDAEQHRQLVEEDAARLAEMAEQLYLTKSELEEKQKELTHLANTDPMTGLANRRHFMNLGIKAIESEGPPLFILMTDIDFFKNVNDTHGHSAGDAAIKDMAHTLEKTIGDNGFCGRLGGEEFAAVIMGKISDEAQALAEQMRKAVEAHITHFEGKDISFTCSIGLADWRLGEDTIEPGLARADSALYVAKEAGRNRLVVFKKTDVA